MTPSVSIVIVNYKSSGLLQGCLSSIAQSLECSYEVVSLDNGSDDPGFLALQESYSGDPRFRFFQLERNYGFAVANNIGAKYAKSSLLHFLNPDTTLGPAMQKVYETGITGSIGVTQVHEKGGCVRTRQLVPLFSNFMKHALGIKGVAHWWLGASVIMSRETFDKVEGWPTDYFMYSEDLDLFYRAHLIGIPVTELCGIVNHFGQGATRSVWSDRDRLLRTEAAAWKFAEKYRRRFDYLLGRLVAFAFQFLKEPGPAVLGLSSFIQIVLRLGGQRATDFAVSRKG